MFNRFARFVSIVGVILAGSVCVGCSSSDEGGAVVKVGAVYATSIEEPWNGAIHSALLDAEAQGDIVYRYVDSVGYAPGAFEGAVRRMIAEESPALVLGDSFGNDEGARSAARDFPGIAFAFGNDGPPAAPNFSVFDNWIHEPAYLSGMLAGGLTKTNTVGIVGGYPVAEVNRLVNAFLAGARAVNPAVEGRVTYLSSWYDPAGAARAVEEQIALGADVFFAERDGVIEAAAGSGLLSFGNIADQKALSPATVAASSVWNMTPTVAHLIDGVRSGSYGAEDLRLFSMMAAGGAELTAINRGVNGGIPAELAAEVERMRSAIIVGAVQVEVDESVPAGAVIR